MVRGKRVEEEGRRKGREEGRVRGGGNGEEDWRRVEEEGRRGGGKEERRGEQNGRRIERST